MRNARPLEAMSREGFGSKVITDIIEYQKGVDLPLFKNKKLMIILRLVVGLRGFKGARVLGAFQLRNAACPASQSEARECGVRNKKSEIRIQKNP
jgi:hypothetical protein